MNTLKVVDASALIAVIFGEEGAEAVSSRLTGVRSSRLDFDEVLALAEATGLTAYDASYLWLARSQNAELVTLDKKLAAAARAV